jgi:hypothetical protein
VKHYDRPPELVQNYEKAAKELIADGKTEAAGKELKKLFQQFLTNKITLIRMNSQDL